MPCRDCCLLLVSWAKHELEKAQEPSAAESLVLKGLPLSNSLALNIIPFLCFV